MPRQMYLNLPVSDLEDSIDFFTKLGFSFNPQFTDENATCMIVSDDIYVMLLVEEFFSTFTEKDIADEQIEALIGITADSKDEVNSLVDDAVAAGATEPRDPTDHGWMYSRAFEDLDGHTWEIFWMDPEGPQVISL